MHIKGLIESHIIMHKETWQATHQKGATMVEYVLLLALIAIITIAAMTQSGSSVVATFESVSSAL